ncbi:hypothetical protein P153DRAFT_259302, partial [Dothidotthia symphoricarpi CBS 119687]
SSQPDAYAVLESAFRPSPQLPSQARPPRRSDEHRNLSHAARPLFIRLDTSQTDNDSESLFDSQQPTPLEPPRALTEPDAGFPPTPPTLSHDGRAADTLQSRPLAHNQDDDAAMADLASKRQSFTTPVNARSPPTPDPSPPRSHESVAVAERPHLLAHPSSRAESFMTAREDADSSNASDSRCMTPLNDRLDIAQEDRGLWLAFGHDDDATPTNRARPWFPESEADTTAGAEEYKEPPVPATVHTPEREWDDNLMRNVTIRKKRNTTSPRKTSEPIHVGTTGSPVPSTKGRRSSSLRERVQASSNSPHTPSIEDFAQFIGWPPPDKDTPTHKPRARDVSNKRLSTASVSSTVVEAMVFVNSPQKRQTLRHSGRNLALRRDSDPPTDRGSTAFSNRHSMISDAVPLHRLIHKKASVADRRKRMSVESDTLGVERNMSPFSTMSSRTTIDSSASTLAHQESIRRVFQPASDIVSRSSSVTRSQQSYHVRGSSAPEITIPRKPAPSRRNFSEISPPSSPQPPAVPPQAPAVVHAPQPPISPVPSQGPLTSRMRRQRRSVVDLKQSADVNKTLPDLPAKRHAQQAVLLDINEVAEEKRPPSALLDRVRLLVAEREAVDVVAPSPALQESPVLSQRAQVSPVSQSTSPRIRRGSRSSRGRSEERRLSLLSQDRSSPSQDAHRPSPDQLSVEGMYRRSHDGARRPSEEFRRTSFDRYTARTEEHAMARHLYAQSTPFSQLSDTPIEVSEATAVSIYPHNNHSLLVVQQLSRGNSMFPDPRQVIEEDSPEQFYEFRSTPTPPFVDASEIHEEQEDYFQPMLTVEPSTPISQTDLYQPDGVDSPLENPRAPPEPPMIMFIPPTPAEELERQLAPGPPKRTDSHSQPQPQLTLVQRARRYSNDLLTPLLTRRGSQSRARSRSPSATSQSSSTRRSPRAQSTHNEDGTLHPFWRPRAYYDGTSDDYYDDDDESDEEDDTLPLGGDTSDVDDYEPPLEPEKQTLKRRLTNGFRAPPSTADGSGGFLIGNSLGVERSGTNRRRHHVTLPADFSPGRVAKRGSRENLRHEAQGFDSYRRRASWRSGRGIPGLKGVQVQYIGLSGVRERWQERSKEKRRDKIRRSIGTRYYVENVG